MTRGRYDNQTVIDNTEFDTYDRRFESMGLKSVDLLDGVRNFEHIIVAGERLDGIAHKYFGDDRYWWIIALINKIDYPLALPGGTKLHIPYDVREVFRKIAP